MAQGRQPSQNYVWMVRVWMPIRCVSQMVLGFIPMGFSTGDQETRQFDLRGQIIWEQP